MLNHKRHIQAVIFDLDDTLIDWSGQTADWATVNWPMIGAVYDFLSRRGHCLDVDRDTFCAIFAEQSETLWRAAPENNWRSPFFGAVLQDTFVQAGLDPERIDLEAAMSAYGWGAIPGVELFPDTIPTLEALQSRGYKLGVITNAYFPMWMRQPELESFGLAGYFDAAITSGDTGWLKPHPAIYWRMLGLLDTLPRQAVFVGDSPVHDIAGANETGLISILHSPPSLNRDRQGIEPNYTIASLRELLPILDALN